jgi:ABC-type amino acid transport substrate-binding protein
MAGFDVRLIRNFAEHMGVSVSFNRTARFFDEVVDIVARGEADLAISQLSRTFARSMRVRFTRPYLVLRQGLLVNRLELARQAAGAPPELAIRNLRGKIGVLAGSSYEGFARERFPLAEVAGFPSWDEAVAAAANGEVVAAYQDEVEIKKIIRSSPDSLIHFHAVILSDTRDPIAIPVNHQSPNLLALLQTYLDDLALEATADSARNVRAANRVIGHRAEHGPHPGDKRRTRSDRPAGWACPELLPCGGGAGVGRWADWSAGRSGLGKP